MDEQRQQAYVKLIRNLLSCPDGEEPEILAAHQELLDAGLLEMVEAAAQMFSQEGDEDRANRLRNLARQLGKALNLNPQPEKRGEEGYFQFLVEVLEATAESEGDAQVIYPLLKENTDKLDGVFAEILQRRGIETLGEAEAKTAEYLASVIVDFGSLIGQFPLGNKASNMEIAIASCTAALTVYTTETSPINWAATQNNLGNAYWDRIRGEKVENIEQAIASYSAALTVYTKEAFPVDWAMTQNNLGNAYWGRIRGEKAENMENAIASYTAALTVYAKEAFPVDWAGTQNNLGLAYGDRIRGDKAENMENAIASYTAALTVRTPEAFPVNWATTQNNLGIAYSDRIRGDKTKNIEQAIASYTAALTVITHEAFPVNWAMTQNNLGTAYTNRIRGEKAENIENAIAYYTAALTVYTPETFPQEHTETLFNLGILYQETNNFPLAYNSFESAIATVELLREEIISGEESKHKQREEWNQLYRHMVEVCLELGNITAALEYVERSKTRTLVELILERDYQTIFPPEVATQLAQLRDEITTGQYQIQNGKAENYQELAQHLRQLREQQNKLQDEHLPVGSGFNFDSFQATLDGHTAIIEWYITSQKILAFIVKPNGQKLTVWQSQPEDREALYDWVTEYLQGYYDEGKKEQWQNQLEPALKKLASILHIDEILAQIPNHCNQLILIPHLFLHLLPLHALPVGNQKSKVKSQKYQDSPCVLDLFAGGVRYAPSSQILQQLQKRERPNFQCLFAIQTPTPDLYETDLGAVSAIKQQFAESYILKQSNAKKAEILQHDENTKLFQLNQNLAQAHNIFFFCHGSFNLDSSLDSGLQLADAKITLADIINHFKLENCRLVTLAACETGVINFKSKSDEYIGLPYGFLLAGSTNVVSSLWTVSSAATALLMVKFYEELQQQSNMTMALNTAQMWLRDTTAEEFQKWLNNSSLNSVWKIQLERDFAEYSPTTKPFASPFYWSGFFITGKD